MINLVAKGKLLPYDYDLDRSYKRTNVVYACLGFLAVIFIMQAAPLFAANSAFSGVGSNDTDFQLFKEKMGQAFTLAYNVGIMMAGLYYVSAVIRYFAEDSGDSARKHLIGSAAALFVAVGALPIVNFVLNGFFPSSEGYQNMSSGADAVKLGMVLFRRMITLVLNVGIMMGVFYIVVAALKYSFSHDGGVAAKSHLIRVLFGVFLLVIAQTVLSAFMYWFPSSTFK